ncbi:MAG TPA: toxin-antitoxin system HicB family antitoxin [Amycolatopsis sp.]|nr:toxin-antitoxin system HicB family antitoxin [Amycolatopsis sp.]
MDLTPYITNLREDLTATASAGDEQTRRTAAVLSAALEPAVRLALMNALADLAAEVTTHLTDHVVEVRLDGRDVRVVVTGSTSERESAPPPPPQPQPQPPLPPMPEGSENIARMTLRMVEQIKGQAEQAAAAQGVSLNTFISQAVQGALHGNPLFRGEAKSKPGPGPQTDSHLHGWVRG